MGGMIGPALQWAAAIDLGLEGGDSTTSQIVDVATGKAAKNDQPIINTVEKNITSENSVEAQSAQRRLARLSRYFTTPTGVLDSASGSTGVF